jgi:tetratricopeptide (TPR) repeat protein/glycosyltransferase involved in cell wall biosynthesis
MSARLSMCLIVGDPHVSVLARCLKSLVERPHGPICDEIVIGWNGARHPPFMDAITDAFGPQPWGVPTGEDEAVSVVRGVRVVIHRGPDPREVGFDVARNQNFDHATGVWRGYIDADDVIPLPEDAAAVGSLKEGSPTLVNKPVALMDWLEGLAPYRNLVQAPYDYISSVKGPLLRTRRPRLVRWDKHWRWVENVHERLMHVLGREYAVYNPGLLFVHKPVVEIQERIERNLALLKTAAQDIQTRGVQIPQSILFGLAEQASSRTEYEKAAKLYAHAAQLAPDADTRVLYLVRAARQHLEMNQLEEAGALALRMIDADPKSSAGYLVAAEVAFLAKKYAYCTRWYEAGGEQPFPVGGMVDDRLNRLMRPVHYIGVAYLHLGQWQKAFDVAQRSLDAGEDPFARQVQSIAVEEMDNNKLLTDTEEFIGKLVSRGMVWIAKRVADDLRSLPGISKVAEKVGAQVAAFEPQVWPADSVAMRWLTTSGTQGDIKVTVPVDYDTYNLISEAAQQARATGVSVYVTSTDPRANDEFTRIVRGNVLPVTSFLHAMDLYGDVESLQLLEGTPRAVVAKFTPSPTGIPAFLTDGWQPDITFFCPSFMEAWGPWRIWREGTGGSEESVIYLAREFARRGYNVQVFAPLDPGAYRDVHIENRVRWRLWTEFDETVETPGILIACRAPHVVSMAGCVPERTYIWHQDAAYAGAWSKDIAEAAGHFFVSRWQESVLLAPVDVTSYRGAVVGDGIPDTCFTWQKEPPARDPYAVAYLSAPVRGLEPLLDMWPQVIAEEPRAKLHIFYGWHTAPGGPEVEEFKARVMGKIAALGESVIWRDRVPQVELESELPKFGVFAYPPFFMEGFCIAGVRAVAAGMVPVYAAVAALGEIQYEGPHGYRLPGSQEKPEFDHAQFLPMLLRGIRHSVEMSEADRVELSNWARKWTWDHCADLMRDQFIADGVHTGQRERSKA